MSTWENRALREARDAAKNADVAWGTHRRECIDCIRAQRRRAPQEMCNGGWKLYKARRDTAAEAAAERELARQPIPGQDSLFPELTQ